MYQTILHALDIFGIGDLRRIPRILGRATHSTVATATATLPLQPSDLIHPHILRDISYLLPPFHLLPAPSHRRPPLLLSWCLNPLRPLHQAQPPPQSLTPRDAHRQYVRHRCPRYASCSPGPADPSLAQCVCVVAGDRRWVLWVFDDGQHVCGRGHYVEGGESMGLCGAFGCVGATVGFGDLWAFVLGGTRQCAGELHVCGMILRKMTRICYSIPLYSNPPI